MILLSYLKFVTLPYQNEFKNKIMRNLSDETAKLSEISSLNFELSYKFVESIDLLLKDTKYNYNDIDFVASHGQTIWHNPKESFNKDGAKIVPSTLQIGDGSVISALTNIKAGQRFKIIIKK